MSPSTPKARPLDARQLAAYTCNMSAEIKHLVIVPCLCGDLRKASRAVSRFYDDELRDLGLRTTQYSLLYVLRRCGEVRQRDLAELTLHDETTLTRNLRPLVDAGWVAIRTGDDRREKWLTITAGGVAKLEEARPAWERAQARMQALLPEGAWRGLLETLPEIARLTAGA
jgi:DNA-binding MarR family transcriptional regulator